MDKYERIENKITELLEVFANLPPDQMKVTLDLIKQAAFMAVTLEDLAESISENGTIEEYTNGKNQSGRKISSDAKLYSSLIAKYTVIVSRLLKILPEKKEITQSRSISGELKADPGKEQEIQRSRQRDNDFFVAMKEGKYTQDQYNDFCDEWGRQH